MSKKKTPTKRKKYANLDPLFNPRVRREFIDYDYVKNLDTEAKDFLSQFTGEYYGAAISKTKKGDIRKQHLHRLKEHAKDAYDSNNRRNNDLLGVTRVNGLLEPINYQKDYIVNENYDVSEEAMIALADQELELKRAYKELVATVALVKLFKERPKVRRKKSRYK